MNTFNSVMAERPAHVFIKYERGATKVHDKYSYGVVGSMPMADLIGYIVRVQAELQFRSPDECGDGLCVIVFKDDKFQWFVDKAIPVDALVGTLELVKCTLVDNQMAATVAAMQRRAQTGLLSADGKPIIRRQ